VRDGEHAREFYAGLRSDKKLCTDPFRSNRQDHPILPECSSEMKGLVMKSTGSWYDVLADDGHVYSSRIRGKIRLEDIKETNPVAVGDYVDVAPENDSEAVITEILQRENYIARKAVKKSGQSHVIAANIDQALLLVSISFPRTSLGFIDRFT